MTVVILQRRLQIQPAHGEAIDRLVTFVKVGTAYPEMKHLRCAVFAAHGPNDAKQRFETLKIAAQNAVAHGLVANFLDAMDERRPRPPEGRPGRAKRWNVKVPGYRVGSRVFTTIAPNGKVNWVCDCGHKGQSLSAHTKAQHCPKCAPKTRRNVTSKGDTIGVLEMVERIGATKGRNTKWKVRCQRCGTEDVRVTNCSKTKDAQACANCRNKFEVFGKLMDYGEIEKVFGVKRTLLLHRRGRLGMTLEEAILTPVQKQNHSGTRPSHTHKNCRDCDKFLPLSEFTKDSKRPDGTKNICKPCRAKQRKIRAQGDNSPGENT